MTGGRQCDGQGFARRPVAGPAQHVPRYDAVRCHRRRGARQHVSSRASCAACRGLSNVHDTFPALVNSHVIRAGSRHDAATMPAMYAHVYSIAFIPFVMLCTWWRAYPITATGERRVVSVFPVWPFLFAGIAQDGWRGRQAASQPSCHRRDPGHRRWLHVLSLT